MFKNLTVYVAGPLFTIQDRDFLERIRDVVRACGVNTFLPHEDNNDNAKGRSSDVSRERLMSIFKGDYTAIKKADGIISVLDGVPVDCGTAWELGFGFALSKPILGIRTDFRVLGNFDHQRIDLMSEAACTRLLFVPQGDFKLIEEGVQSFLAELKKQCKTGEAHSRD